MLRSWGFGKFDLHTLRSGFQFVVESEAERGPPGRDREARSCGRHRQRYADRVVHVPG